MVLPPKNEEEANALQQFFSTAQGLMEAVLVEGIDGNPDLPKTITMHSSTPAMQTSLAGLRRIPPSEVLMNLLAQSFNKWVPVYFTAMQNRVVLYGPPADAETTARDRAGEAVAEALIELAPYVGRVSS